MSSATTAWHSHAETTPRFQWTEEQAHALDALRRFLVGSPGTFVLAGYAGTGKTTLIVEALKSHRGSVCFTAPTHKAVGVLHGRGLVPGAEYATIHRLLGCRRVRSEGQTRFVPDPDRSSWGTHDVVVVDEVSMVGETMWSWLRAAQERSRVHLILLGDPAQLPPVNDGDGVSPAFDDIDAQLTQVMRSAGIVLRAAHTVRQDLDAAKPVVIETGADELGRVERLDKDAFLASAVADFRSGRDAKILAWTNAAVDFANGELRRRIFGDDVPDAPQPGERLVCASTWTAPDDSVRLHSESEVDVEACEQVWHEGMLAYRLDCGLDVPLHMLHPASLGKYRAKLASLRHEGRARGHWQPFYALQDAFADLRPGYATTVHKSQGSTYETCYVIDRNLCQCHDPQVRNMLRYVAFSRAASRLVVS